jgi:glutaredoxin
MITIYGTPTCTYCEQAKNVADSYDLKYEYVDLSEGDNMKLFQEKFPGVRTVPQILWHDRHVGGFNEFVREIEETRNYGDGKI